MAITVSKKQEEKQQKEAEKKQEEASSSGDEFEMIVPQDASFIQQQKNALQQTQG